MRELIDVLQKFMESEECTRKHYATLAQALLGAKAELYDLHSAYSSFADSDIGPDRMRTASVVLSTVRDIVGGHAPCSN